MSEKSFMPEMRDDYKKKRAARKKRIRKRRITIGILTFFALAISVGVILCLTVLFPVKNVSATGSKIYTAEQIINAFELSEKDNIFTLSQEEALQRLEKKLPYIDSVKIERSLPDSITLKVSDATEFACYNTTEMYYVVSRKGRVLRTSSELPTNVFEIKCPDVSCEIGKYVKYKKPEDRDCVNSLLKGLTENKIHINSIDISDRFALSVKVEGRFIVDFGSEADLSKKINHLVKMIENIDSTRTGKINLSMWTREKSQGSFTEGPVE